MSSLVSVVFSLGRVCNRGSLYQSNVWNSFLPWIQLLSILPGYPQCKSWLYIHFATSNIYSSLLLNSLASHGIFFVEYLALINRAGGLYGRILTKVASTDRTQWGLYQRPRSRFSHTDRPSSVNKMFIIWPNKKAKEQKHQFRLHVCS